MRPFAPRCRAGSKSCSWTSFNAGIGRAEKRLTTAKKKLAASNRTSVLLPFIDDAQRLRKQWQTMTLSRQHQIVAATLQHIEVRPARRGYNRFDESRLTAFWRP